jgi:Circularly permutated YpsA SLOG family
MLQKIISGGQTGADRAALDFAIARGSPHGGWCPRGRLAEDGTIPARYQLVETPSPDYAERTEWNVRDSDGTVIFSIAAVLTGGSKQTADLARQQRKPCLHLARERDGAIAGRKLVEFLEEHAIKVLNVAGPRQSQEPGAAAFTRETLEQAKFGL